MRFDCVCGSFLHLRASSLPADLAKVNVFTVGGYCSESFSTDKAADKVFLLLKATYTEPHELYCNSKRSMTEGSYIICLTSAN